MSWRRFLSIPLLVGCMLLTVGCQSSTRDAPRARVSGKVTLDSRPLKTGTITFDPGTGEPPAALNILDGVYEGKAAVGKNKVTLSAIQKVSMREKMKMDGPGYDAPVEQNVLPDRYNTKSQITREVEATGDNQFHFDLQSK